MGSFNQFAVESVDPIELRIYPGANGNFILYEDENDNYNYEKAVYSVIEFSWDDKNRTLTIEDRKGEFPGMIKERTFKVILVNLKRGTGVVQTENPDKIIHYDGKKQIVVL